MSGEIATAYVRIRPSFNGFREATTTGVKESLAGANNAIRQTSNAAVTGADRVIAANEEAGASFNAIGSGAKRATAEVDILKGAIGSIGKAVGVAFGADVAFKFVKGLVTHAADLQKQVEVIKSDFGGASEAVTSFSEKGALALGLSAHQADTAAAKMGIFFKINQVGKGQAAAATVDLLKLAGSIVAVRNANPDKILQNLPLALTGNTRALKQLGVAMNAQQIQAEAYKLHLAGFNQPLTTGQRALAIVAIATAHLGQLQKQAAAHAGDFANVNRRLGASFDNTKDALGSGLLPAMTKFFVFVSEKLPGALHGTITGARDMVKAFDKTREVLKPVTSVFGKFIDAIGGVKGAIIAMIAAFAVAKIVAFAGAIKGQLVENGLKVVQRQAKITGIVYDGSMTEMELATKGLSLTIKEALISVGFGALIVAIGIVTEYVITHWDQVKRYTVATAAGIAATWTQLKRVLVGIGEVIAGALSTAIAAPLLVMLKAVSFVTGKLHFLHIGFINKTHDAVESGLKEIEKFTTGLVTTGAKEAADAGSKIPTAFMDGFKSALQNDRGSMFANVANLFSSLGDVASRAALAAIANPTDTTVPPPTTTKPPIDAAMQTAIRNARSGLANLRQQLSQLIAQNKIDIAQAVTDAKSNLLGIASALAQNISDVIDQPFTVASMKIQAATDRLTLVYDRKNAVLQAQSTRLNQLQAQLSAFDARRQLNLLRNEVRLPGGAQLSTDYKTAAAQLKELERSANPITRQSIEQYGFQYLSQLIGTKQSENQVKSGALDAAHQRATTRFQLRSDAQAVAQDVANTMKIVTTRTINDLSAKLASGAITAATFSKRLNDLLRRDHVTFTKTGNLLGSAFLSGMVANITGVKLQAAALQAARAAGVPVGTGTGQEPKIIRPEVIYAKEQLAVVRKQHTIQVADAKLQGKIKKAAEKTAANTALLKTAPTGSTAAALRNPGKGSKKANDLAGTGG